MNSPKVNIILATYNGAKFIKRQLESLLNQTYENIDIYVRDDGSTDTTMEIIAEVAKKNNTGKNIIVIENNGQNLRCPASFYEILKLCKPAKYYSLCDQDDEWYPNKVRWAVERLETEADNQILLYYTASDYRTEEGELIRKSPEQKEQLELKDVLYYTPGSGFTIVINEQARQKLLLDVSPGTELHDRWLIRSAVCFGKVLYDKRSSATHIRHSAAVTAGDAGNGNLIRNYLKNELCGNDAIKEKEFLTYFYQTYSSKLSEQQKKTLLLFCENNSVDRWFRKVFYPHRLRTRLTGEVLLRVLFFVGKI